MLPRNCTEVAHRLSVYELIAPADKATDEQRLLTRMQSALVDSLAAGRFALALQCAHHLISRFPDYLPARILASNARRFIDQHGAAAPQGSADFLRIQMEPSPRLATNR